MTDTVVIIEPQIDLVEVVGYGLEQVAVDTPGVPGPPGPPGSAGAQTVDLVAAQPISGHRVLVTTPAGAVYADPADTAHADAVVGLSTGAALTGGTVNVLSAGEIVEPSWSWTPGLPLYVTAMGMLSHTPPLSGWVQIAALSLTPTRILLTTRQTIMT